MKSMIADLKKYIAELKKRYAENGMPVSVRLMLLLTGLMTLHVFILFFHEIDRGMPSSTLVFCMVRMWLSRGLFTGFVWMCFSRKPALWAIRFTRGAMHLKFCLNMLAIAGMFLLFSLCCDLGSWRERLSPLAALAIGFSILFKIQAQVWKRLDMRLYNLERSRNGEQTVPMSLDGYLLPGILMLISVLNFFLMLFYGDGAYARIMAMISGLSIDLGVTLIPTYYFTGASAVITHLLNIAALSVICVSDYVQCRNEYRARVLPVMKDLNIPAEKLSDFISLNDFYE